MTAIAQEIGGGALWLLGTTACILVVVGVFILVDNFFGKQ
jgi:hypothetical protein